MLNAFQRLITRRRSGFIVALHEITPERVTDFVECFRPAQPVHLSELVSRARKQHPTSGLFAITVDDGVGDNVRQLARVFRERGWPATFYLPTGYLDTCAGMMFQWWRAVRPLLPRRVLHLSSGTLDLTHSSSVGDLARKLERSWHSERLESYQPLIMELVEITLREGGIPPDALATPPPVSWAEVAELARADEIRFESHGVSHTAFSALTEPELAFELKHSRDAVAEHTGRECRHLAYPFGSWLSIGPLAARMARTWYASATTMSLGCIEGADPWLLPRIPLYPSNSTLTARLKRILASSAVRRWRASGDGPPRQLANGSPSRPRLEGQPRPLHRC